MRILNDIRYSLRQLIKSPGFTVVAVVSLALGIGANTAIFSLINGMLLKSLPVRDAHELRYINWGGHTNLNNVITSGRTENVPSGGIRSNAFSMDTYHAFREQADGLSNVIAFSMVPQLSVIARGTARTAFGLAVSGDFFDGLGLRPELGRTFNPQDDRPGAEPVAMLSYAEWQKYFNGDTAALGQSVTLNGQAHTLIGVLPPKFTGLLGHSYTDVYVPLSSQKQLRPDYPLDAPGNWGLQILVRMKPDADERQVRAGLEVLLHQSIRPDMLTAQTQLPHILLRDSRRCLTDAHDKHMQPLLILMAIVVTVLFVACLNLAGLLLARGATRQHELAVRTALGARRRDLLRQSLTECLVLIVTGAGLGMLLAIWGKMVLAKLLLPTDMPLDVSADWRVLGFTLGISLLAVALFGLIPALRASWTDPMGSLKNRTLLGTPRLHLGRTLVAIQVGLCMLLVVGAGLFTRTLINLRHIDVGFKTEHLLIFRVNARNAGYEGQRLIDFYKQFQNNIVALPGVKAAAHSNMQLLSGWRNETMMIVPDIPGNHHILRLNVSDSFLSTMGIPLLAGRNFQSADNSESAKVILVNQRLAKTVFKDQDPIGRSVIINRKDYRIAGLFGDTKYYDIKVPAEPTVLFSARQHPESSSVAFFQIRTASNPLAMIPAIRKALADLDPEIPIAEIKTQTMQLNESIAQERLFACLGSALASLAVLIACIGLYGLMAYNVTRRTNEVGIRMALGACPKDIAWPIMRSALIMACAGIAVGLPVALAVVRIARSLLFGVEPYDPVTLAGAAGLLIGITILAALLPARRAARIDPMKALRCE